MASRADFLFLTMSQAFPKKEKLKSQKLIGQLFEEGTGFVLFPFKLIYLEHALDKIDGVQAGFVVPKKNFKSAVKRNRIKRLLREAYRLNKSAFFNNIEGKYALMILYLGKELPVFGEVEEKTKALLATFVKKISNEKNS